MRRRPTRRDALKQLGKAGAAVAMAPVVLRGQGAAFTVAGRPVEVIVASISPATVRITVAAVGGALFRDDGALVRAAEAAALARRQEAFGPVTAGDLIVRVGAGPTLIVETQK